VATFYVPRCGDLQHAGGRWMTYQEYRLGVSLSQAAGGSVLPLTEPLFDALVRACRESMRLPAPAPRELGDFPLPTETYA
jgi:hypothetical protein